VYAETIARPPGKPCEIEKAVGVVPSDLVGGAVEADNDVFRMRRFGVLTHPLTSLLLKTVSARSAFGTGV
jgi:hypothetical protein